MKTKKNRTAYLSYIEETSKHFEMLNNVATNATKDARKSALENGMFVTYLDGNKIMREYPSGHTRTFKTLEESSILVSKNGELQIP
jgi:hypothetical protein